MTEPTTDTLAARVGSVLDQLTGEHTGDGDQVLAARRAYEERRGKVHEDDPLWERWTTAFIEWFVVERIEPDDGRPLAARSLGAAAPAVAEVIAGLVSSHRSLFEISRVARGGIELLDLLGGARFRVTEQRTLHGIEVGDVAEVRLVGVGDELAFARTFVFHPRAARAAIVDQARALLAAGRSRLEVIDAIAALRLRVERFRHLHPARVYEPGSKLG